jgi:hypothetical protein
MTDALRQPRPLSALRAFVSRSVLVADGADQSADYVCCSRSAGTKVAVERSRRGLSDEVIATRRKAGADPVRMRILERCYEDRDWTAKGWR